jgi:hypothetical protein
MLGLPSDYIAAADEQYHQLMLILLRRRFEANDRLGLAEDALRTIEKIVNIELSAALLTD